MDSSVSLMFIICIVIFMILVFCAFNYYQTNLIIKNAFKSEKPSKDTDNEQVMQKEDVKNIVINLASIKKDNAKIYIQYGTTGFELPTDVIESAIVSLYPDHFQDKEESPDPNILDNDIDL